jgi:hypothetical protein
MTVGSVDAPSAASNRRSWPGPRVSRWVRWTFTTRTPANATICASREPTGSRDAAPMRTEAQPRQGTRLRTARPHTPGSSGAALRTIFSSVSDRPATRSSSATYG